MRLLQRVPACHKPAAIQPRGLGTESGVQVREAITDLGGDLAYLPRQALLRVY